MSATGTEYVEVVHRELPYATFDADNHLYENGDALTKFLPPEYAGIIKYVDVNGRTKVAIRDTISDYIPNPTFSKVGLMPVWFCSQTNEACEVLISSSMEIGNSILLKG